MTTALPRPALGYPAGAVLRDVTLAEARAWTCNRCGDCCNGLSEHIARDEATGLPRFVWGAKFPADRYASRYGRPLLLPVVEREGQLRIGDAFEVDADGAPYTSFACAFHRDPGDGGPTTCALRERAPDPADLATIRPLNCGEFPVFGTAVDNAIIGGHSYTPATGALPRCEWHGIRIVGPWRDTPYWRERWERQQRGEPVPGLTLDPAIAQRLPANHTARTKGR